MGRMSMRCGPKATRLGLLVAIMTAACSSTVEPQPVYAVLDEAGELTLSVGDLVQIEGTRLRLGVLEVPADSRCPVDVDCVWAGDAEVGVSLAFGSEEPRAHRLHSNAEVGPSAAELGGYRVTVVGVEPEPRSDRVIAQDEYRVRFRVEEI